MFKIEELILYNCQGKEYKYKFSEGINYFKGKNSSGKTKFYNFLDFMLGASIDISKDEVYKNSLNKATLKIKYNKITFLLTRTKDLNQNYFSTEETQSKKSIDQKTYKQKINSIFCQDEERLKEIRDFTGEELTYRTFTMFNFLGERRQGNIQDFLDKCSDIKYSVKLNSILDFIFNNNLDKIFSLQKELNELIESLNKIEQQQQRYNFIIEQVNSNLLKLGGGLIYTGKNVEEVKKYIDSIKEMKNPKEKKDNQTIAHLQSTYNSIYEQIKNYNKSVNDMKKFNQDNNNRKKMLFKLENLIEKNPEFNYLIFPMKKVLEDVEETIFFSNYIIKDKTMEELIKNLDRVKNEIKKNDSKFKCYTVEDKIKAIALIEEYLSLDVLNSEKVIKELQKNIREIKEKIKILKNSDDENKINQISEFINKLYNSAKDISSIVSEDIEKEGFEIKYLKKGNILQPVIKSTEDIENNLNKKDNFYSIGSMARHTLIQLCGYLSFMKLMLKNGKYPLIPILVIDHISKPFDKKNLKAIGCIIDEAYKIIGKDNFQIFIFDNEEHNDLNIKPSISKELVTKTKTGFNPFYISQEN